MDDRFNIEVINEEEQSVTLMTKSNTGKVLSVANVRPTIFEVLGEHYDFTENFDLKSQGRNSFVQTVKTNKGHIKKTLFRPTYIVGQYLQVMIEQVLDSGSVKSSFMVTQDMQSNVLSTLELDKSIALSEELHLETVQSDK